MKTFIYKVTTYPNRTRNNRELTIYRVKENIPIYIGSHFFSIGSSRGDQHEVFNYLMENGYIPKKYYNSSKCSWRGGGYFAGEVENFYRIIEV